MHSIAIDEIETYPTGSVFKVVIGCQTYFTTDRAFAAEWVGKYINNPSATHEEWKSKYSRKNEISEAIGD